MTAPPPNPLPESYGPGPAAGPPPGSGPWPAEYGPPPGAPPSGGPWPPAPSGPSQSGPGQPPPGQPPFGYGAPAPLPPQPVPSRGPAKAVWILGGVGILVLVVAIVAVVVFAAGGLRKPTSGPVGGAKSATPSASSAPAELRPRMQAAALPVSAVTEATSTGPGDWASGSTLINCKETLAADSNIGDIYERTWKNTGTNTTVVHHVFAYRGVSGTDVVTQVKETVQAKCKTYVATTGRKWVFDKEPTVQAFAGLEGQWAYCMRIDDPRYRGWTCHAYLARGELVSQLVVSIGSTTGDATYALFNRLLPQAAELLAKS